MSDNVVLAGLAPHPAIIVPEVGRGGEKEAADTVFAMEELGRAFSRVGIETLVIVTPHGPAFTDAVSIPVLKSLTGDFGQFGAKDVSFQLDNDLGLVDALVKKSAAGPVPIVPLDENSYRRYRIRPQLDHGVLVPLYYLRKHGFRAPTLVVNIGFLPYNDLYRFGKRIAGAASSIGRKIGVLASGDLSHRLKPGAPAGYDKQGKVFDELLVERLRSFAVEDILSIPQSLTDAAGECGLRPITIMLGALDGVKVQPRMLSYEGPFGVGYAVALFEPTRAKQPRKRDLKSDDQEFPVFVARTAVQDYLKQGGLPVLDTPVPEAFSGKAGVFVSIYKDGELKGCIGTIEPTTDSIAHEIMQNAVRAAVRDPRFSPVVADELEMLDYSVDVLSKPEPVADLSELDPKKYGVLCVKGRKKGLLLPDLPGVDTVEKQLSIAKQKAGISAFDTCVKIYRFTVERYF